MRLDSVMRKQAPLADYSEISGTFSPSVYHLFADANLSNGRGNTEEEAASTILSWLRLVPDTRFAALSRHIELEWASRGSVVLFRTNMMHSKIDFTELSNSLQEKFTKYIDNKKYDTHGEQEWMETTALELFGKKDAFKKHFLENGPLNLLNLLIDVLAVRFRGVLREAEYPFFVSQGFVGHAIGFYFLNQTECVICNSGAGLNFHARRGEELYLTQYRFQTSHMDRVLAVIRLNGSFMLHSDAGSLYENLMRVTSVHYIPQVTDEEVHHIYPQTDILWVQKTVNERGFVPHDPVFVDDSFFRPPQISGSCTFWSTLFWIMYVVHENPSLGRGTAQDKEPLSPDMLVRQLRLHVGRHLLRSYLNTGDDVDAQTFSMLQIIANHSPEDHETQMALKELGSIFFDTSKMIFNRPVIQQSKYVLNANVKKQAQLDSNKISSSLREELEFLSSLTRKETEPLFLYMSTTATNIGLISILLNWKVFKDTSKDNVRKSTLTYLYTLSTYEPRILGVNVPRFDDNQKLYILLMMLRINDILPRKHQIWHRRSNLIPQADVESLVARYGSLNTPIKDLRDELHTFLRNYPIMLAGVYISEKKKFYRKC